jgi:hypothetical protein
LAKHGLGHLAKPAPKEVGIYLVAALTPSGEPRAGLRLHRRTADRPLPLEEAVELPRRVKLKLDALEPEGLAELCAVWVAPDEKDRFLALRLVRYAMAAAPRVGLPNLVAFGGQHSIPLARRAGFQLDPTDPVFPYPDHRFLSRLVWDVTQPPQPFRYGPDATANVLAPPSHVRTSP